MSDEIPPVLRDVVDPQSWLEAHYPKHARGDAAVFRVACASFAIGMGIDGRALGREEKIQRVAEALANRVIGAALGPTGMMDDKIGERVAAPFFDGMPTIDVDAGTWLRVWGGVPSDEERAEICEAIREHGRAICAWYADREAEAST